MPRPSIASRQPAARAQAEGDRGLAVAEVDRGAAAPDQRARQVRQAAATAGRGRVDDQVELAQRGQVVHVARMHATRLAQRVGQRIGPLGRAVDHEQLADAGIQQRGGHAAGAAAGAQQQGTARAQVQPLAAGQVAHQPGAVGVVAMPGVAVAHQGVDRAGAARAFGDVLAQVEGDLLQRQGDVGAGAAVRGELGQRLGEMAGLGVDRPVIDRNARLPPEGVMDAGRQRVRDRMPEHRVMPAHAEASCRTGW
jgi:hypothetical protein